MRPYKELPEVVVPVEALLFLTDRFVERVSAVRQGMDPPSNEFLAAPRLRNWSPRALLLLASLSLPGALSCAGRADLAPRLEQPAGCPIDPEKRLVFTVSNLGEKPARATSTTVQYDDLPLIHLATRPMAKNQSQTLSFRLPDQCLQSTCRFEIQVDFKEEVVESNEGNNQVRGECVLANCSQPRR